VPDKVVVNEVQARRDFLVGELEKSRKAHEQIVFELTPLIAEYNRALSKLEKVDVAG